MNIKYICDKLVILVSLPGAVALAVAFFDKMVAYPATQLL